MWIVVLGSSALGRYNGQSPKPSDQGYPAISTLLKEHQGRRYLLAANSSREPVRARIAAGAGVEQVEVMFEDRRLAATSAGWENDFAPLRRSRVLLAGTLIAS